jgi:hypothetical protein
MKFRNEQAFLDATVDLAKATGWMVMHMRGDTHRLIQGMAGYPDLTLAKRFGEPWNAFSIIEWWELKMPHGELTDLQAAWGRVLGPAWRCFRPDDWEKMREHLMRR